MARTYTPDQADKYLRRWAQAKLPVATLAGALNALQIDASESRARAPFRTGALRKTVRVVKPSAKLTLKTGDTKLYLAAGHRTAVRYASVLQRGTIGWPPRSRSRPHVIASTGTDSWRRLQGPRKASFARGTGKRLAFLAGGKLVFAQRVQHKGSRWHALNYLQVDQPRVQASIDRAQTQAWQP